MNDPIELKALDEYLKRDSAISQHYRELGGGEVPPELDRRVLEQARAAVVQERAQGSRIWLRWSAPVALAASVVLAVAIVLESGVERDAVLATKPAAEVENAPQASRESRMHDSVSAAEQVTPAAPPPSQEAFAQAPEISVQKEAPPAKVREERRRATSEARRPSESTVTQSVTVQQALRLDEEAAAGETQPEAEVANAGQLAAVPPAVVARQQWEAAAARKDSHEDSGLEEISEVAVTGARARLPQRRNAGPRDTIAPSSRAETAAAAPAEAAADADPEEWLEEIRELRRDGKENEADREWERFRAAFPDYRISEQDLARKRP